MIGYNSDPIIKKLFINEEDAKVVKLIFEKYMALVPGRHILKVSITNTLGNQLEQFRVPSGLIQAEILKKQNNRKVKCTLCKEIAH